MARSSATGLPPISFRAPGQRGGIALVIRRPRSRGAPQGRAMGGDLEPIRTCGDPDTRTLSVDAARKVL